MKKKNTVITMTLLSMIEYKNATSKQIVFRSVMRSATISITVVFFVLLYRVYDV